MADGSTSPLLRFIRKLAAAGPEGDSTDAHLLARFVRHD